MNTSDSKRFQRSWHAGIGFGILLAVVLICFLWIWAVLLRPTLGELRVRGKLTIYPNSEWIGVDQRSFGADTASRSHYYFSGDDLHDVEAFFKDEGSLENFVESGDRNGQWLIALAEPDKDDVVFAQSNADTTILGHGSYCDFREIYTCATVVLVDTSQENLSNLAVITPSTSQIAPEFLHSLPPNGTLIIYSYWVDDF